MREVTVYIPDGTETEGLIATTLTGDKIFAFTDSDSRVILVVDVYFRDPEEPATHVLTFDAGQWQALQSAKVVPLR